MKPAMRLVLAASWTLTLLSAYAMLLAFVAYAAVIWLGA